MKHPQFIVTFENLDALADAVGASHDDAEEDIVECVRNKWTVKSVAKELPEFD